MLALHAQVLHGDAFQSRPDKSASVGARTGHLIVIVPRCSSRSTGRYALSTRTGMGIRTRGPASPALVALTSTADGRTTASHRSARP